jgi:hypothetical protein
MPETNTVAAEPQAPAVTSGPESAAQNPDGAQAPAADAPAYAFSAGENLSISEAGRDALIQHYSKLSGLEGEEASKFAESAYASAIEHTTELTQFATENKLSTEQANALFARDHARYTRQQDALVKQWESMAEEAERISRADKVIGGPNYDKTTAAMEHMLTKLSHKDHPLTMESLARWGLDRDPAVRHFLNNLFQGQREPTAIITGNTPAPPKRLFPNSPTMYEKKGA